MTRQQLIRIALIAALVVLVIWAIAYVMLVVPAKSGGGLG